MVCKVIQRNVRVSSRKAKLVCDLIRNKPIKQALVILQHNSKKASKIIKKLLESAIANATNNHAMNAEKLYVYNIFANQGPTWKRTMPRARGSADMIFKRTTHIEIHLSDDPNERYLYLQNLKSHSSNKTDKKIKKVITNTKEVKKEKPKMVNGISTDQKHIVVTTAEFDEYNYQKRLKDWRKKAGYNEKPHTCYKCKEGDCHTSILLENKKHICYTCWIKKPDITSSKGKNK